MVTHAFHDCRDSAVPHAEALTYRTIYIEFSGCGTVGDGIAGNDIVLGLEIRFRRWSQYYPASGKAFGHIIIGITYKFESQALAQERAEALAC